MQKINETSNVVCDKHIRENTMKNMKNYNQSQKQVSPAKAVLGILLFLILLFSVRYYLMKTNRLYMPPTLETALFTSDFVAEPETVQEDAPKNPYTDLSVPTYVNKIGEDYFIVDCYHNQVIYNSSLTEPLANWKVLTSDMEQGHTIVSDGTVYLVDDTENNRILIFEKVQDEFVQTQVLNDIGVRPHFLIYDEARSVFYAWSSMTGELYLINRDDATNQMYVSEIKQIKELDQVYVRSVSIIGDEIYFVSGNSKIIAADLKTFRIKKEYPVPDSMAGMIQIVKIQGYYYITVSTDAQGNQDYATILRTKKLSDLEKGKYEDIYSYFVGGGTPYYITSIDGAYYLTEHRVPGHSIWSFKVEKDEITDVKAVY